MSHIIKRIQNMLAMFFRITTGIVLVTAVYIGVFWGFRQRDRSKYSVADSYSIGPLYTGEPFDSLRGREGGIQEKYVCADDSLFYLCECGCSGLRSVVRMVFPLPAPVCWLAWRYASLRYLLL